MEDEFDIVWNGTMDKLGIGLVLVPPRETKVTGVWTPPPRLYNKTGNHTKAAKEAKRLLQEIQDDTDEDETGIIDPLSDDF